MYGTCMVTIINILHYGHKQQTLFTQTVGVYRLKVLGNIYGQSVDICLLDYLCHFGILVSLGLLDSQRCNHDIIIDSLYLQ